MSVIKFLACSNKPIPRNKFFYKDILPNIKPTHMCGNGSISFIKELSSAESSTILNIFSNYHLYAIHTDIGLGYETGYKTVISPTFAKNAFDEMLWFKKFVKILLAQNDMVFLLTLDLGYPTDKFSIKTKYIDINKWDLCEYNNIIFQYGVVYQFVDNERACKL